MPIADERGFPYLDPAPSFGIRIDGDGQCSKLCGKDYSNIPIAFPGVSEESYAAWLAGTRKKCAATDPAPRYSAANGAATAERP